MRYEWHEQKRQATLQDRGIDFADVEFLIWETALTMTDIRHDYPETRYVTLGFIHDRLHVCAWCYRDSKIRIISLRKANAKERKSYEHV
jgi:uncharacterized DUF497 family protein